MVQLLNQATLQEQGLFAGKRTSLQKLLKEMGFRLVSDVSTAYYVDRIYAILLYRYKKVDNRRHYYEQPRIIEQRHSYLQRMMRNRTEGRPVVFLDETWANAHDGKDSAWVERDTVTGGTLGGVRYYSVFG